MLKRRPCDHVVALRPIVAALRYRFVFSSAVDALEPPKISRLGLRSMFFTKRKVYIMLAHATGRFD